MRAIAGLLLAAASAPAAPMTQVFAFDSAEAAQKAWTGTPPPMVGDDPDVGRCLVLTLPFAQGAKGASWDRSIALDLTTSDVVSFLMHISDSGAVGGMGFYFRSGDGWYARFQWGFCSGWSKVTIPRAAFGTEGTPAGWDKVTGIRVTFWPAARRPCVMRTGTACRGCRRKARCRG